MADARRSPGWYVGAYTADMGGTATGIAALGTMPDGSLEHLGLAARSHSPSYLAASGDRVYAVCEATGRVEDYRRGEGIALELVASAESGGTAPCHIARYDDTLVASCYVDGRLGVLSADALRLDAVLEGDGRGPHPAQDGPHAHATFRLDDGTVLSADLGADRVHVHRLSSGVLERLSSLALPPGTGPRDFAQHPHGAVYVLGELGLEVLVLDGRDGRLRLLGSTPLPGAEDGDHAAALTLSADGRYLWAGLRGSNRISVLGVSDDGRRLVGVGSVDAAGDWPRHHVVDGDTMHVAHERSNSVASFHIGENGIPTLIAPPIRVSSPIFLLRA